MRSVKRCRSLPASRIAAASLAVLVLGAGWARMADAAAAGSGGPLVLTSKVTLLEDPHEALPVRLAAQDLQSDLARVFGVRPRIVTRREDAGPAAILIAEESQLPAALRPAGATAPESFSISVHLAPWSGSMRLVVLTGPDIRGTIYAIYQFSKDYLGVDPMYYWTDRVPPRRGRIGLPDSLARVFPPPVFKYRGFFINDEDLLTGWAPGQKAEHSGISPAVMSRIYETILRLKGNMVVPGTWIFPSDSQVKLAGERGLILTQHHAMPLGVNVARWPADVPYDYSTHPEILERAWKDTVAAYDPHQEILWSVGLRGLSDTSYASMDPSVVGNDKRLGMLISKAIATEMRIVRAVHPDAQFVTDFWQEGARLVHDGYLKIPHGVTPVWADVGYGIPQDGGDLAPGEGVYYHVAMLNGRANHLTEMVPVGRIYSELGRYIKAGATGYVLVNTSNTRQVAMTSEAVMNVAWGGVPAGGAADYYERWAAEEFGERSAPALAKVYTDYFDAFSHIPAGERGAGEEYGDQLYHSEAQGLLLATMVSPPYYYVPSQDPKWTPVPILGLTPSQPFFLHMGPDWVQSTLQRELSVCGSGQAAWDAVWHEALAAEPLVAPARRRYYVAEMLTMIAINRDSNQILYLVSSAVRDFRASETAKALAEAKETLPAFDEIERMESAAEYGKWRHWYRGEWLDGIGHTRALVETFIRYLHDPMTSLPPPVLSDGWEGYYHIMHYEGDEAVDVR
ncbi:MAG TPA: glycosyl hydrolase 115 family protein [Steroidobacteraceae bacterium]|nr:glycosyl hydrolase 115 family protein [Steroidobacteraceae bacterium]